MQERRREDTRIDELVTMLTEQNVLVKQVHTAMFGENGNKGLKAEWEMHQGGLQVWKGIAGSGGLIALGLLILEIVRFVR
jgi:hypothetical protein